MSSKKLVKPLIYTALIVALPYLAWTNKWYIYDTVRLHNYSAPAEVKQLATDTTMSAKTRNIFYVFHPDLQDKQAFNASCNSSEKTIVLGCFVPTKGIYLFRVTDPRLEGVLQVTAAHEALHAVYQRLSTSEKKNLSNMLMAHYAKITDQRIIDTIKDYKKNGADITNELHSILGTEVRDLSPELEKYYSKYFNNRKSVVNYSEKYEQAFSERKQKIAEDDAKLVILQQQINSGEASLSSSEQYLRLKRQELDSLLANKQYEQYNAGVNDFNFRVNKYNSEVRRIKSLIDQYNAIVNERNAIAAEEGDLIKAIDSRPSNFETQ